jgi:hypothetical protein
MRTFIDRHARVRGRALGRPGRRLPASALQAQPCRWLGSWRPGSRTGRRCGPCTQGKRLLRSRVRHRESIQLKEFLPTGDDHRHRATVGQLLETVAVAGPNDLPRVPRMSGWRALGSARRGRVRRRPRSLRGRGCRRDNPRPRCRCKVGSRKVGRAVRGAVAPERSSRSRREVHGCGAGMASRSPIRFPCPNRSSG